MSDDPAVPPAPPRPRRRPPRWLAASVVPAVIGAAVAVAATTLVDVGGDDGSRTVTVVQQTSGLTTDGLGSGALTENPEITPAPAPTAEGELPVTDIVRRLSPGVTLVTTGDQVSGSLGTGFLVDRDGHILTNAHVVGESTSGVTVTFENGEELPAKVLGRDEALDVAVLKIASIPAGAAIIPLGSIRTLEVGDPLVAIGNPLGYRQTVTTGIVSALKRTIDSPNDTTIQNVIQTDAAINQGNSGGPLIDRQGRVVGINSQIATEGGGNLGIGFAVPIDTVKPVADSIIRTGTAQHAWIGIVGASLTPKIARANDLAGRRGVMVVGLDDRGPAKKAGLKGATSGTENTPDAVPKGGDIIVRVDGRPINDMGDVSLAIASKAVGAEVDMTVLRDGAEKRLRITLADRPDDIR